MPRAGPAVLPGLASGRQAAGGRAGPGHAAPREFPPYLPGRGMLCVGEDTGWRAYGGLPGPVTAGQRGGWP
jgi:hypothetical protein